MRPMAREIAARRSNIGHKHRITYKDRITDVIGEIGRGVAGYGHCNGFESADKEHFIVGKQMIELRAVHRKFGIKVK